MILIKYKNDILKFMYYVCALFLVLFILVNVFETGYIEEDVVVETSIIEDSNEEYNIYVEYPRFNNDNINFIITDVIYSYVKDFKFNETNSRVLDITYELYYFDEYVNIAFHIENTLSKIKNKNILINLNTGDLDYISSVYDKEYLSHEINNLVYYKYSSDIYDMVASSSINNFTYILSDNSIDVYFNNINLDNLDYIPYITIDINDSINTNKEVNSDINKKYIAFTYDDGPSEYTGELLRTLELNNSSATFFMIGNRMKNYSSLIEEIYYSNSEIGSHTYSHKDLSKININGIKEELNSTNIIYSTITGENLKYLRPPYNNYNDSVLSLNYEIVTWNIDPKDWLVKDSTKIYNSIISSACDGCIVLMHDIYPESIEATKMMLPKLNEMGYEVVSVSKLAEIKGYDFASEDVTSEIKKK